MRTPTKAGFTEPARTEGISPKAIVATAVPLVATIVGVVVQLLVTGEFDRSELVTAISGASTALLAGGSAAAASPGVVTTPTNVGTPSDDLLMADPEVRAKLTSESGK